MTDESREDTHQTDPGAEESSARRRRGAPWLLGGLVLLLLSVLVVLQVFGLWEIFTPDTATDTLLVYALSSLNFVAFIVFTFIFVRNLLKLRRERRERQLGSKIKTRLVVYFITVSLLPITAMAVFSYIFFNRSLEKWFSSLPEDVIRRARAAQEDEAARQEQSLRDLTAAIAVALNSQSAADGEAQPTAQDESESSTRSGEAGASENSSASRGALAPLREAARLSALEIISPTGEVLERSAAGGDAGRLDLLSKELADAWRAEGRVTDGFRRVAGFKIAVVSLSGDRKLLAAREREAAPQLEQLVTSGRTFEDFKRRQRKVRLLGLSTLGLLTLLLLFAATWSAIHLARGIGMPIRALAEAADEVAGGNLEHRVTTVADDELALLAASFNQMTEQLQENRRRIEAGGAELREKNLALAERRDYIETILESLSTGVISLDGLDRVTTINAAAVLMLRLEAAPRSLTQLSEIVGAEDHAVLERVLRRARLRGRATEQMELARAAPARDDDSTALRVGDDAANEHVNGGATIPVALTAIALGSNEGLRRGVVLVVEDLSELLAAQRAAAWSEVARRMAHEIKNPLTPIQLSAERIARNLRRSGENGGGADDNGGSRERERVAGIVEECTATITREVAGLKAMVDEFSRFARLPHARLEPSDLNEVARQALTLYEERIGDARLDVSLGHALPGALLDPEQIRRVFVNLIDNALEALSEESGGERRVTVATGHDPARGVLLAEVSDTGHGITPNDTARLFQPYFSTRGRGTGLGLAIVQRIIADHGGRIRAEQNRPRGARFIFELPVEENK